MAISGDGAMSGLGRTSWCGTAGNIRALEEFRLTSMSHGCIDISPNRRGRLHRRVNMAYVRIPLKAVASLRPGRLSCVEHHPFRSGGRVGCISDTFSAIARPRIAARKGFESPRNAQQDGPFWPTNELGGQRTTVISFIRRVVAHEELQ